MTLRKSPWVAGQFAWTGFDYLGECFPFHWPVRNGLFGIIDLAGFPKDSYYIYQADWTDEPSIHIIPQSWNFSQYFLAPIPVWVYSNCEEVELFVNNRSLGVKKINRSETLHAEWLVKYEAGELKAVGRTNGQIVCTDIVRTSGEPAGLEVLADRTEIAADGTDLSFLEVRLVDKNGVTCRDSDRAIRVTIEGAGTLAGIDNGSASNHSPFKGNQVETCYGRALVILKSTKKAGAMQVKISADGVKAATATIATLSPEDARLAEVAMNRDKARRDRNKKNSRHHLAKIAKVPQVENLVSGKTATASSFNGGSGVLTVAPVFKHGLGQHADSVVASRSKKPPTWSEMDARRVIVDEAKRQGVTFILDGKLPIVEGIRSSRDGKASSEDATSAPPGPLVFDGVDQTGKIVFEILTSEDVPDRTDNTDRITDFLAAAQKLAEELKTKSGDYVAGVFYDPLTAKGTVADEEPLRAQVRDFIAWLKKEKKS
ncbi:MAG: DUF4982 domain-containing protein [Verrucomicrobia bacterium]|nr:DUF4982 domain-containing protein [Verrucomicrobiota bacterium]